MLGPPFCTEHELLGIYKRNLGYVCPICKKEPDGHILIANINRDKLEKNKRYWKFFLNLTDEDFKSDF